MEDTPLSASCAVQAIPAVQSRARIALSVCQVKRTKPRSGNIQASLVVRVDSPDDRAPDFV